VEEALLFQLFELSVKDKGLTAEGAEERRGFKQFFKECLAMANKVSQNQGFLESAAQISVLPPESGSLLFLQTYHWLPDHRV